MPNSKHTEQVLRGYGYDANSTCSWLGRWSDVGWAIRIAPRLRDSQWKVFGERAEETWNEAARNYDAIRSLELLGDLFPTHELTLKWPSCGKRTMNARDGGVPVFSVCGAKAQHAEVHVRDVNGNRVAMARCDAHEGQL